MPLVSIITPSWNVERLIGETIESVQAQTFGDWELLIADDCSTDRHAGDHRKLCGEAIRASS